MNDFWPLVYPQRPNAQRLHFWPSSNLNTASNIRSISIKSSLKHQEYVIDQAVMKIREEFIDTQISAQKIHILHHLTMYQQTNNALQISLAFMNGASYHS